MFRTPLSRIISLFPLLSALLCLGLLPGLALPARADASGPLGALITAQKGIDQSDSDLFNQAVDIPTVVDRASDALLTALREEAAAGRLDAGNLGMVLALAGAADNAGQTALIKQLLISEVKSFVASGINGGYFAGSDKAKTKASRGSLASALDKMPKGRREIRPGSILSHTDNIATVSATFIDPEAGSLPLELALEQQDGGNWRVTEILNAKTLFEQAARHRK